MMLPVCRYHFRRAREINPRNSGLDAQLGTILLEREKGGSLDEARELLERYFFATVSGFECVF